MSLFSLSIPMVKRAVREPSGPGPETEEVVFHGPDEVKAYCLRSGIREWAREAFVAFYLNSKNGLIHSELISIGTINTASVYPREVARIALETGAASVVFSHNHPAEDPSPSLCDRDITRDLVIALGVFQVKVLDHIIVTPGGRSYSFNDQGLIANYQEQAGAGLLVRAVAARAWVTP
jgi:DNA repair protein RadC